MVVVFDTVNIVRICVFMICSIVYCLCDTRIHGMYIMHVRIKIVLETIGACVHMVKERLSLNNVHA
jgi:hypothetical protein